MPLDDLLFEPFYFDSDHAWGRVYTTADWERIVWDSSRKVLMPRVQHARQLLDSARLCMPCRQNGHLPMLGTRSEHTGATMRSWARERDMERILDPGCRPNRRAVLLN